MAKRMLIDATHPEETRVVVINGNKLEEFDFETSTKKQLKGNIYLAKVTRVEPSLQAAFVEYGGNRHGFLAFNEIHPDYWRLPVADRQALMSDHGDNEVSTDIPSSLLEPPQHAPTPMPDEAATLPPFPGEAPAALEHTPYEGPVDLTQPPPITEGAPPVAEPAPQAEHNPNDAPSQVDVAPGDASAPATDLGAPQAEPIIPPEQAPAEARSAVPAAVESGVVESLGGDDMEDDEVEQRRRRPLRHYKIQEVVKRRQVLLVQVVKEERGTKGAALTTYLSLAGRYCVLMPNTDRGGGISRRITSLQDRKRLKNIMEELDVPEGMAVILRTAGMERNKAEIKRDYEYLMRLWEEIRDLTLKSTAPCLVYEEGTLIKRAIRDLYAPDIEEILVEGADGYRTASEFMKMLMPGHGDRIRLYEDPSVPLFQRYQIEAQLDEMHSPTVRLRSGGYVVINPTEALVSIDVNSGKSTRERHIEDTAYKTNLEAADEIARQLRLRDLAGLIVIDFIDMEDSRNQAAVERRLKEAMKSDRARIQIGRISPFGLLELSRQRLRPSLLEVSSERCPHCAGSGFVRSTESTALHLLRGIEEEGGKLRSAEISVAVPTSVAIYVLNQKRAALSSIESRYGLHVTFQHDDTLIPPAYRLERVKTRSSAPTAIGAPAPVRSVSVEYPVDEADEADDDAPEFAGAEPVPGAPNGDSAHGDGRGRRRRRRRGRGRGDDRQTFQTGGEGPPQHEPRADSAGWAPPDAAPAGEPIDAETVPAAEGAAPVARDQGPRPHGPQGEGEHGDGQGRGRRRRRGRRGGRRNREGQDQPGFQPQQQAHPAPTISVETPPVANDWVEPAAAPPPVSHPLGRSEGPGDAHDWPWNRRAERFPEEERKWEEPAANAVPAATPSDEVTPAVAPQAAPVIETPPAAMAPEAKAAPIPPAETPAAPVETIPAEEEKKGPTRSGWWRRLRTGA
jgi:ribonuclease E